MCLSSTAQGQKFGWSLRPSDPCCAVQIDAGKLRHRAGLEHVLLLAMAFLEARQTTDGTCRKPLAAYSRKTVVDVHKHIRM